MKTPRQGGGEGGVAAMPDLVTVKPVRLPSTFSSHTTSTIITPPPPSPADIASAPITRLCAVCARQLGKYVCPQCNVQSCSLPCYRQHSQRCTERFQHEQARSALATTRADDDAQKRMRAIISRAQSQQSDADTDPLPESPPTRSAGEQDATETDEGVDEEEEALRRLAEASEESLSLSSLTAEQQRHFLRAVKDGRLSHLFRLTVPWWVPFNARRIEPVSRSQTVSPDTPGSDTEAEVYEVESEWEPQVERVKVEVVGREEEGCEADLHRFLRALPPLSSLSSTPPSPFLAYHVLDVLFAFCYVYRLYNCEPQVDAAAFLADFLRLSTIFSPPSAAAAAASPHHTTTASTMLHCLAHARGTPALYQSPGYSLTAVRDATQLAMNEMLALRALKELWELMGEVRVKERVKRKLWFLLLWLRERGAEAMPAVGREGEEVLREEQLRLRGPSGR